jgi:Flp pilus assembly protein TadD
VLWVACQCPGKVDQRFIKVVLLHSNLSQLEPRLRLLRLQADRLLKLRSRVVEVQPDLIDPAEAEMRACIVGPQLQIGGHFLLSGLQLLFVEQHARLGVQQAWIVEVQLLRGGQRLLRFRIQLHFALQNADVVIQPRMPGRKLLCPQQGLQRWLKVARGSLVERDALARGHFAVLRLRVSRIRRQRCLKGGARLRKLPCFQQRASVRSGTLSGGAGCGQYPRELSSKKAHREAVSTMATPRGNAPSRIIGPRMAGIFAVAGLTVSLALVSRSLATLPFASLTSPGPPQAADAYQQGQTAFAAHRYAEAAGFFAQAETRNPGRSDALLMEAKSLANADRFAESEQALRAYLSQHAESSDATFMLGFVLNRENKPADSLKAYTQAARLATPKSDDLKVVALDYVLLDDYPDAIHWMERAVALDPRNEEAWYGLGRCYYSQSRFADAENAFRKALALNAQDVKAEANLGLAYEMDNCPNDAEHAYQAAVALANADPHTDEWPFLDYASFLLEHNRPADALPLLQRAVAVAPRCADCHGKLGRALTLSGKADAGVAELRRAVALSPKDPKLHYDLGRAYRAAGQMDRAKAEMDLSAKLYGAKDTAGPQ